MTSPSTQTGPAAAGFTEEATRPVRARGRRWTRWFKNPWVIGPVGMIMVASWLSAYSAWTDSVQASTSASAGSIHITAGGITGLLNLSSLNLSNILPGATQYAGVPIKNTGTSDVVYSMASASSDPNNPLNTLLGDALQMGVTIVPNGTTCDAASYSSPTAVLSGMTTGLNQTSVFAPRPLSAGQTETLCFKEVMPLAAPISLMSAVTNTVFTFTAVSPN